MSSANGNGHADTLTTRMALASYQAPPPPPRRVQDVQDVQEASWFDTGNWIGGWLDLFDRFRQWPGEGIVAPGASQFSDRRYGDYWPFFRTEAELALYRQPARILARSNSATIGLLNGVANYCGNTSYRINSIRGQDAPQELIDACQAVVDAFTKDAAYEGGEKPGLEKWAIYDWATDGDFISCLEHDGYGTTTLVDVYAEQLTLPPGYDPREWNYGILTDPKRPGVPLAYNVREGDDPQYDRAEYEPEDVLHWKCGVPRTVKRGLTVFCFDNYTSLNLAGKFREAMGEAGVQQAGIVGVRQHKGATSAQIGAFADQQKSYSVRDPFTGRQQGLERRRPGRWEDVNENFEYVEGPKAGNVPNHVQVLSELHRAGGRFFSAPDWLISGDTSAANFATSLTAESPFVRAVQDVQQQRGAVLKLGPWRALENACRAGKLVVNGVRVRWEEVKAQVEITATAPSPQTRNKLEEAQRDQIYLQNLPLKSPQQVCEEQGWDYEKMQEERSAAGWPSKEELMQMQQAQAQPGGAGGFHGAGGRFAGFGGGGDNDLPSGTSGEMQKTSDADRSDSDAEPSLELTAEQTAIVEEMLEAFDSSKHPRGNPKNKGQFSHGGGGGSGPTATDILKASKKYGLPVQQIHKMLQAHASQQAKTLTPQASAQTRGHAWADKQAHANAGKVAAHLGLQPDAAHKALSDALHTAVAESLKSGSGSVILIGPNGKRLRVTVKHKGMIRPEGRSGQATEQAGQMGEEFELLTETFDPGESRDDAGRWTTTKGAGHGENQVQQGSDEASARARARQKARVKEDRKVQVSRDREEQRVRDAARSELRREHGERAILQRHKRESRAHDRYAETETDTAKVGAAYRELATRHDRELTEFENIYVKPNEDARHEQKMQAVRQRWAQEDAERDRRRAEEDEQDRKR